MACSQFVSAWIELTAEEPVDWLEAGCTFDENGSGWTGIDGGRT